MKRIELFTKPTQTKLRVLAPESAISVYLPEQYRVYQRVGTTGDIYIIGYYRGTGGIIEARFNGGTWTEISAKIGPGEFRSTLAGQAQGQGDLEFRMADFPDDVLETVADIGVGDIYVIAGQSNASGRGDAAQAYTHTTLKAASFGNDYRWHELADPVDTGKDGTTISQVDAISYDPTAGGSPWPLLATAIMADQGVPVAFVPCARGGTTIQEWQPATNHQDRATLYGSCLYRILQVGGAKAILWWQGEADALDSMIQATYNTYLDTLANALYADSGIKLMPCKMQNSVGLTNEQAAPIWSAVAEAWADNANVLAGPDLSGITSDDDFHLRVNAKLESAAALWWDAIEALLYS